MLVKSSELTRGEKVVLQRRRDGYTLEKAAKRHKVKVDEYREWELDQGRIPNVAVGKVADHERCFIARRRSGMTLAQLAKKLKCCRWWLHQMENGEAPVNVLMGYWERRKK